MRLHATLAAVMLASCAAPPASTPAPPSESARLQRCASSYLYVASHLRRDIPAYPVALQRAQELTQRLAALDAISLEAAAARVADVLLQRQEAGAQREPSLNLGLALPETQGCDRTYGYPLFDPVPPGSPPPVPLSPQPPRN